MAITLYHDVPSNNCDRVKIALAEKGLAWEGIRISLANKEQKSPEFLKLNPYGKIPVLADAGKVMFESCIINEYLEDKYPTPSLLPKDPYLRARGRILVDYALNFTYVDYWAMRGEMRKPAGARDMALVNEKYTILRKQLKYLEDALGNRTYFLGDFSLIDIAIVPRLIRMELYGALPVFNLPKLMAWLQRMKDRPSVKATL